MRIPRRLHAGTWFRAMLDGRRCAAAGSPCFLPPHIFPLARAAWFMGYNWHVRRSLPTEYPTDRRSPQ